MELALLLARLLLAAVFLLAGVSKLADRKGASKALADFGLPQSLAQPLSLLLSIAEIAVGAALVPVALAFYGACAALALLSIFLIGIAINLARGRRPDCRCFGQLHSAPVGASTLVRNGILGAIAGWLVYRGPFGDGPSLWGHLASAGGNERRLFIVAAVILCFLVLRAMRPPAAQTPGGEVTEWEDAEEIPLEKEQAGPSPREYDPVLQKVLESGIGWPIGTQAPEFVLPDLTEQKRSLRSLLDQGKTICLVFSSLHCESCRALWPDLGHWAREYDDALNLIIISRGTATEKLATRNQVELSRVMLQQEFEMSDAYGVTATPAAVLVGADGLIRSQLAVGRDEIQKLIASSAKIERTAVGADAAPDLANAVGNQLESSS